jgi:hypothetical protein
MDPWNKSFLGGHKRDVVSMYLIPRDRASSMWRSSLRRVGGERGQASDEVLHSLPIFAIEPARLGKPHAMEAEAVSLA